MKVQLNNETLMYDKDADSTDSGHQGYTSVTRVMHERYTGHH